MDRKIKILIGFCLLSWLLTLISIGCLIWRERGPRQFTLNKDVPQLMYGGSYTVRYLGTKGSKREGDPNEKEFPYKKDLKKTWGKTAMFLLQSIKRVEARRQTAGMASGVDSHHAPINLQLGEYTKFRVAEKWYQIVPLEFDESKAIVEIKRVKPLRFDTTLDD